MAAPCFHRNALLYVPEDTCAHTYDPDWSISSLISFSQSGTRVLSDATTWHQHMYANWSLGGLRDMDRTWLLGEDAQCSGPLFWVVLYSEDSTEATDRSQT